MTDKPTPDFDSIRHVSENGAEFWSARDLAPLLGYTSSWQNFETAIRRAKTACIQVGQLVTDHFNESIKPIRGGQGAIQNSKDYLVSRFGAYLTAQNGDPRKPQIATAQAYFATSARENELYKLVEQQNQRLELRERLSEGNEALSQAARQAGVLPRSFGLFQRAGYEGLYGGLGPEEIKKLKGIDAKEDLLDRMGYEELADNYFRVAQTAGKLRREGVSGQEEAIETHREVSRKVRGLIGELGGELPEDLPAQPSIKPLLQQNRRRKSLSPAKGKEKPANE